MRYTTVIDISENRALYLNHNARLLYLHMALKAGYHDDDRDQLAMSIRGLAIATGISISATRHALKQLQQAKLCTRNGQIWTVTKWVAEGEISKRAKTKKQQREQQQAQERVREQSARDEEAKRDYQKRTEFEQQGKTSFMVYYEAKMQQAQQGDVEAAQIVEKNKKVYEQHRAAIEQKLKENKQ